jgi:putative lipoprotein
MTVSVDLGKLFARVALSVALVSVATHATGQTIQGTATYRERMTLPPAAVFEATIEDVSRADAPSMVIATTRMPAPPNPPIAFTIAYNLGRIVQNRRYVVRTRILVDGKPFFTSDVATPVITGGNPTRVSMLLRRVAATQPPPSNRPLEATYWKAVELAGKPVPAQEATREANLVFQGGRVSGSDGCNRFTGTYQLKTDSITFGQMAGTQMACPGTGDIEQRVRAALKAASRVTIVANRLQLFDGTGTRVAAFEGQIQP